ncbi:MAG: copper homeostasis protein CutC [Planctomycetes bacterium]|nr:copper homeostasis protein CutC [Planctomycetota bacterium]
MMRIPSKVAVGYALVVVLLEVCVDSLAGLRAAVEGGAGRLEVCSRLDQGGLTPTDDLLTAALATGVTSFAMIRPRGGDFVHTREEIESMWADLARTKALGAHGFVLGVLDEQCSVPYAVLHQFVALASPLPVTFHRAFDRVSDREHALETLIACGVTRVLTSGGADDAHTGRHALRTLVEQARGRITILPGGGVRAHNAAEIVHATGVNELHSSTVFQTG